jgi:hypothetical protein
MRIPVFLDVCGLFNTTSICTCSSGWQGNRCQTKVNFCENVTCFNNGVCRPFLLNYTCECLDNSYSGQYCETTITKIVIYQTVAKSFACIAITAIVSVFIFIIVMDVLKYWFGIDPTDQKLEQNKRKSRSKRANPPSIVRFIYVNASVQIPSDKLNSITKEIIN